MNFQANHFEDGDQQPYNNAPLDERIQSKKESCFKVRVLFSHSRAPNVEISPVNAPTKVSVFPKSNPSSPPIEQKAASSNKLLTRSDGAQLGNSKSAPAPSTIPITSPLTTANTHQNSDYITPS
jgi:hypothetical protein